jgi:WD40 repeat protein
VHVLSAGASVPQFPGITALAISPDDAMVATADGTRRELALWRASDGARQNLVTDTVDELVGLAFTPDGRYLVSLEQDGPLQLRHAADGTQTGTVSELSIPGATALALSGDGTVAYVAATAGVLRYALPDLTPLPILTGHAGAVVGVAASADGKRVASASADGTARVHCLP